MDLLALAIPFFMLALLIEWLVDRRRGSRLYRLNDAVNSLSAGILSTTIGYFTRLLPLLAWGLVLQHLALIDMPLEWFDASPGGIALWIVAALAWDFCYYWFHRISHEMSILWAAHAVHHQSEDYNLSTALRQTSTGFLFGWVFYTPLFLVGFPLQVLLTVNAVNLIYQFWVHTQLIDKLGVLDRILVTPSNHRVHHAQNERYIDRNYGGMFIIWDRIFGSYAAEDDAEAVVYGVRKPLANWNPFWANLQVYAYLWFDACRTAHWRDRLGIWFRRTGWRPADVAQRYPKQQRAIAEFEKYDPPVPAAWRPYLLGQFTVALVLLIWISIRFVANGAMDVLLPCVLLWSQLYAIGLFAEGRPIALRVEMLRLLLLVPGLALLAMTSAAWLPAASDYTLPLLAYLVVSLLGLGTLRLQKNKIKTF